MKAPHPSLQRLFGLAAAPAQHAQTWRSQGAALAALDAAVDDSAAASDARIEALLGEPQVGSVLASPLARLAAMAHGAEAEAALAGRQRLPTGPRNSSPPIERVPAPLKLPTAPAHRPAGMPPPAGTAAQRRPVSAAARAGAATSWPVGVRPVPSARRESTAPDASGAVAPQPGGPGAAAPAAAKAAVRRVIDAPTAAAQFDARAASAGAAQAWLQAMDLQPAPGSAPPSVADFDPVPAQFGDGARGIDMAGRAQDAATASQRVEHVLARLAAEASPRAPEASRILATDPARTSAAARQAAGAAVTATGSASAAPGSPLQAAHVGGFRGLAALGRVARPASGPAAAAQPVAIPGAAHPQPAALDPQAVIDHVESALREQAARSGVSIEGLEP